MSLLKKILIESPVVSINNGLVMADEQSLKSMTLKQLESNIVLMRQPTDGILSRGFTMVYFMDSDKSSQDMKNGLIPYIIIPEGRIYGEAPLFQRTFSKSRDKQMGEGVEKILGFIQGYTDDSTIRIDFMKVRKEYRRQGINSKMVEALKDTYPNAIVTYDSPTPDGKKFIKGTSYS